MSSTSCPQDYNGKVKGNEMTPTRLQRKSKGIANAGKDPEKQELCSRRGKECKMLQPFRKISIFFKR